MAFLLGFARGYGNTDRIYGWRARRRLGGLGFDLLRYVEIEPFAIRHFRIRFCSQFGWRQGILEHLSHLLAHAAREAAGRMQLPVQDSGLDLPAAACGRETDFIARNCIRCSSYHLYNLAIALQRIKCHACSLLTFADDSYPTSLDLGGASWSSSANRVCVVKCRT